MTTAFLLSASFIIILSFFCIFLRLVFVFVRGYFCCFLLGWYSIISRNICLVHYCCFCLGRIWSYSLLGIHPHLFLFLNFSFSLNFLSNSLTSFLSSPMLLFGVGQNLRPSLSKFIWYLFNLCVYKFTIFGLMLLSFFYIVFYLRFVLSKYVFLFVFLKK